MRLAEISTKALRAELARREQLQRAAQSDDPTEAIAALRTLGGPGRGNGDEFYQAVAGHYSALVVEDEPHPVKTLGEIHHVTISAASRWIKEARRRGYLRSLSGWLEA